LLDRLKNIRVGTEVRIRYTGPQTSRTGRLFKGFEVFVYGNDDEVVVDRRSDDDAIRREA
jgi:hypothetical protein